MTLGSSILYSLFHINCLVSMGIVKGRFWHGRQICGIKCKFDNVIGTVGFVLKTCTFWFFFLLLFCYCHLCMLHFVCICRFDLKWENICSLTGTWSVDSTSRYQCSCKSQSPCPPRICSLPPAALCWRSKQNYYTNYRILYFVLFLYTHDEAFNTNTDMFFRTARLPKGSTDWPLQWSTAGRHTKNQKHYSKHCSHTENGPNIILIIWHGLKVGLVILARWLEPAKFCIQPKEFHSLPPGLTPKPLPWAHEYALLTAVKRR